MWELPLRELPESLGELPLRELPESRRELPLRELPESRRELPQWELPGPEPRRSEQAMFPRTSIMAFAHWYLVRYRTQEGRANSHDLDLIKSAKVELIILNN